MFQKNLLREQASCELLKLLGDRCSDSWTECYSGRQVARMRRMLIKLVLQG